MLPGVVAQGNGQAAAGGGPRRGGAGAGGASGGRVPLRELMDDRLLDALLERSRDEAGGLRLTGEGSMLGELVAAVLERALAAELTAHLGYEPGERSGRGPGNARNGSIAKTVQTGVGPVPLRVPRDRAGTFEPLLVPKRAGRVAGGLDDMVIACTRTACPSGTSSTTWSRSTAPSCRTRRSPGSPTRCWRRCRAWQSRPLDAVYAVVFLDAIMVKVRDNQVVQNKPAYLAVGIDADGEKHVLGIWLAKTPPETATAGEGARFWGW